MKNSTRLTSLAICLLGAVLSIGCPSNSSAPDPTVQLTIAADSLAASETILTAADQLHAIPASARPAVASAVYVAQKDLAAAQASLGQPAAASALAQVQADVQALVVLRTKYPTTQPATAPGK